MTISEKKGRIGNKKLLSKQDGERTIQKNNIIMTYVEL